jgi:outer membrane lipoprotein-sorting protein
MIHRRALLVGSAALLAPPAGLAQQLPAATLSDQDRADITRVEAYLDRLRSLRARFVQVSQAGAIAEGRLYLQRPGRMRLDYADPTPLLVIAASGQLIQHDRELKQTTYLLVSQTPAAVLLRETVRLAGDVTVVAVERAANALRIGLVQTADPRAGRITLVFAERPLQLSSWVVVDGQGAVTRVTLSEIETGIALDPELFRFREEPQRRD